MITETKNKKCFICGKIIKHNWILYAPKNDLICSNPCLIKYRKINE